MVDAANTPLNYQRSMTHLIKPTAGMQTTTAGDTLDLEGITRLMGEIVQNTKSHSTKRAYRADWKIFENWCRTAGKISIPAESDTLCLYLVSRHRDEITPATIRRSMTAIRQIHQLAGLENPITERVKEVEKGIRRTAGVAQLKAIPISAQMLERVIKYLGHGFRATRDRALLSVAWSCALRSSEIVGIECDDLEFVDAGYVLTIRKSKTDQSGRGHVVSAPYIDGEYAEMCSVRLMKKWLEVSGIEAGPIFRACGPDCTPWLSTNALSTRSVTPLLKRALASAEYPTVGYSAHSLRAGFCTAAAAAGSSSLDIMRQTGHKSIATMAGYVREGRLFENHPLDKIFKKL